ncbi:MAG: hypothetical protein FJ039_07660 [Chloroflexi bacterium]|nr:hypothetical protein [Chloroflexota bacterium]
MTTKDKNRNQGDQVGDYIMWEDKRFRVWDQVIQPGETVGPHRHILDYFIVTLEPSKMTAERLGGGRSAYARIDDRLIWVTSNGEEHTATNVGDAKWRNLIIELKEPKLMRKLAAWRRATKARAKGPKARRKA